MRTNRRVEVGYLRVKNLAIAMLVYVLAAIALGAAIHTIGLFTEFNIHNATLLTTGLVCFGPIIYISRIKRGAAKEHRGRYRQGKPFQMYWVLLGFVMMSAVSVLMSNYTKLLPQESIDSYEAIFKEAPLWITFISAVIIAPITEELLFRHYIQRGLVGRISDISAILVTSLIFGIIHFSLVQSPNALVISLIFCTIYHLSGYSLWCTITLHAINNLISVTMLHTLTEEYSDIDKICELIGLNPSVVLWICAILVIMFLFWSFKTILTQNNR